MERREAIKKKIKALLDKTTENGASESEAISALQKAKDLMVEYLIEENEVTDPLLMEKCVLKETPLFKSGYDISNIYPVLSKLFDTKHYWNSYRVCFFGYEEDVELCIYFYNFILKACAVEKDKYVESAEFKKLRRVYHGRTLSSSFVHGFINSVCSRMITMYEERKETPIEGYGLALIRKVKRVEDAFDEMNVRTKEMKHRAPEVVGSAYDMGVEKGRTVQITQGIKESKEERTKALA